MHEGLPHVVSADGRTSVGTKILVLGGPGAGKSTLARQIGQITGLPVIHLDQHYWRPGWREPDRSTWHRDVANLIERPGWVMDGNYGGTLALRLAAADTVIFLDLPTRLCLGRVLRRIIRSFGRTRSDMAQGCPERLDFEFLVYVWRYRRVDRFRHLTALAEFGGEPVTLRRPAEVVSFVRSMPLNGRADPYERSMSSIR